MAGFFSLQPAPEGQSNLSDFASGNPSLQHVGSSQTYLDPSQGKGETLHSPFEGPADLSVTGNRGSGLMNPTGDAGYVAPTSGTSAITGAKTSGTAPSGISGGGGSTLPSGVTQQQLQNMVSSITGTVQKGLSGFGSPTGESAGGTGGISDRLRAGSITTDDYNQLASMSKEELDKFLQDLGSGAALQTQSALTGTQAQEQPYSLGANIQLTDPTTGKPVGALDWGKLFQGGAAVAGGATTLASGVMNKDVVQSVGGALQTVGGLTKLAQANPDLLKTLGLDENTVNAISTVSGGAGALLGVYGGIKALQEGNVSQGVPATLSGLLSGYNALQSLSQQNPEMFGSALPSLGSAAYDAISAISPKAASALQTAMSAVSGTASTAASGVANNLNIAGGIGAAVSAVLGIIASETGNADLGKAAQALGMAVGAIGTAVTTASTLAAVSSAMAAGATAAAAGASVGLTAGAGVALLPVAAMLLVFSIGNMISPDSFPDISDLWTGGKLDDYLTFGNRLMKNEKQQGVAISNLEKALPYVQTKEELGQLINSYNNYLSTTQNAPININGQLASGGHGAAYSGDPYTIGSISGMSGTEHGGKGSPYAPGENANRLQAIVNELRANLPGQEITVGYDQGGGLSGEAGTRLWTQFLDREQNTPYYLPQALAPHIINQGMPGEFSTGAINPGLHNLSELAGYGSEAFEAALRYGQPGYDYAAAGMPEPGRYLGSYSPYWMQVTGQANPEYNNYQFGTPIDLAGRQYVQHVPTPEELQQAQYYQDFTSGGM